MYTCTRIYTYIHAALEVAGRGVAAVWPGEVCGRCVARAGSLTVSSRSDSECLLGRGNTSLVTAAVSSVQIRCRSLMESLQELVAGE